MIGRRIIPILRSFSGRRSFSSFTRRNHFYPATFHPEFPFLGFSLQPVHARSCFSLNPYIAQCLYSTQAVVVDGTVDVPLAQTGEGIAECELLRWFVQEGDQVDDFQPLCEVQSDKANIEITSRYKGRIAQILHVPGDIVKVGETLLKMVIVEESQVSTPTSDGLDTNSLASELLDSVNQMLVPEKSNTDKKSNTDRGVLSTPVVRNLAKQHNINIDDVCGTGKDGRVLNEDVLRYAGHSGIDKESPATSSCASAEKNIGGEDGDVYASPAANGWTFVDKTISLRGFQRTMVKTMSMAVKVPHFHYVEEINCDALTKLKATFQKDNSDPEVKYTFLPLLIKSLSMAMTKYPLLNSCFSEELQEIILKGSHNIGIAMATPNGLVVPNIKRVQSLSILEITKELSRLQQLASTNKLSPADIGEGTITLSNIGTIGGKFGSPILNIPEVAIIAMGRIQKVPQFADDGSVHPVPVMTINIGADHRVLDGATVARFCNEWKLYIEKPELLLLHTR